MNILQIIREEVQRLFEQRMYRIPELADMLRRKGWDSFTVDWAQSMLTRAFRHSGDAGVIETFAQLAGVQIEAVGKGRYMFANLVDPEQLDIPQPENLNEIGDAGISPYQWVNTNADYVEKTQRAQYNFDTDDGLEYYVFFNRPDVRQPDWRVDFQANDLDTGAMHSDTSTNRGEPLKIMSTIADIIKDFVVKMNPQVLNINAAKEGGDDGMRRLNLYQRFVERNLPEEYKVDKVGDKLIITKSNRAEYFETVNEVQDNAFHTPDEMPS